VTIPASFSILLLLLLTSGMDILAWSVSTQLTAEEQADLKRIVARIVEELLGGTGEDDALALYIATLLLNKRSLQHVRNELAVLDFSAAECDSFVAVLYSALVPEAAPVREAAPPDSAVAEQGFAAVMEATPVGSASDSFIPTDSQAAAPTSEWADSSAGGVSSGTVLERPSLPSTGIEAPAAGARPPILTKRKRGDDVGIIPSPLAAQPAAPPFYSAAGSPPAPFFASSRGRGRGRGSWRGRGGASLGTVPPSRPPTSSVVLPRASLRYVSPTAKPLDVQPTSLGPVEGSGRGGVTGNSRGGGRGRGGFAPAAAGAPAPPPVNALSWVNKKSITCKWGAACQHILCDYGHPEREGASLGALGDARGVRPSLKFGSAVATTAESTRP